MSVKALRRWAVVRVFMGSLTLVKWGVGKRDDRAKQGMGYSGLKEIELEPSVGFLPVADNFHAIPANGNLGPQVEAAGIVGGIG